MSAKAPHQVEAKEPSRSSQRIEESQAGPSIESKVVSTDNDSKPLLYQPGFRSVPYHKTAVANNPLQISSATNNAPMIPAGLTFPTAFNIYDSSFGPFRQRRYIGTRRGDILYRLNAHSKDIRLLQGLAKDSPVASTFYHDRFWTRKRAHVLVPVEADEQRSITMTKDLAFTVVVPAPGGNGFRPESFEWRKSNGEAVKVLGCRRGFKLVRLSTDAGGGGGEIATSGGEVVAVMSDHYGWSFKALKFMFQGSGAQGVLGNQWRLVAVMTAVGIWDRRRRAAESAAAASAAHGG